MPAPAGYEEVAAPVSAAKAPAGYDVVPAPPPTASAEPKSAAAPSGVSRFLQGVGLPASWDELSSQWHDFANAPSYDVGDAVGRMAKGYVSNVKQRLSEGLAETAEAGTNIHKGEPILPNLGKAGYAFENAMLRGPGAIVGGEAVQNFGEDIAVGNYRGATGDALASVVQALMLRGKGAPSAEKAVNKLGYAAGGEVPAIKAALPEIQKTVGVKGVSTIGDLADAVQQTATRLDQKFNAGLARMRGQFMPTEIADALEQRARMQSPSTDGQAIAKELRDMKPDYQRPWTDVDLNKERMLRNAMGKGFYNKPGSGQMAAMRSSAQTIADQTIADAAKDLLYGRMERAQPGQGFQALKQQQSHLIDVMDQLDGQIDRLTTQQAKFKGAPLLEKPSFTVSASPHSVTPRAHIGSLIESVLGKGPLDKASEAVAAALPNTAKASAGRRAAVLALPLSKLAQPAVPPPPSGAGGSF